MDNKILAYIIFSIGIITFIPLLRFSQYRYKLFILHLICSLFCPVILIYLLEQPWANLWMYNIIVILAWAYIQVKLFSSNYGYLKRPSLPLKVITPNQPIDLILPIYNPHDGFETIIMKYYANLCEKFPARKLRLLITNDGSSNNFGEEQIKKLREGITNIQIIDNKENYGKGYALRTGVSTSESPLVLYTDYDFPFTIESIVQVIHKLDEGADIVIGTRDASYSGILPGLRRVYSMLSRYMNKFFLGLKYTDTQGGLKGFNAIGKSYFLQTTTNEFLFDTEFIYRASLDEKIKIVDVKVKIREDVHPSNMGIKIIIKECVNFINFIRI